MRAPQLPILGLAILGGVFGPLTACDGATSVVSPATAIQPEAALVVNDRSDVDTILGDFCTGEDVHIVGSSHFVFSNTTDLHGGFHLAFTSTQHLNGVGLTTGATYLSLSANSFSLNIPVLPFERTRSAPVSCFARVGVETSSHFSFNTSP